MKLRIAIFVTALFAPIAFAYAQNASITETALEAVLPKKTTAVLLARVSIYDPLVARNSKSGTYIASFTLKTDDPVQRNVRYRISFYDKDGSLAYAHVFDDSITLLKGLPVTITKSFPIPIDLSGTYEPIIHVVNNEGLPLAAGTAESVTFGSGNRGGFAIEHCSLDGKIYDKQEKVAISCKVSGSPAFGSTLEYALYRDNRAQAFDKGVVSLGGKTVSFSFPAPAKAGVFNVYLQGHQNGALVGKTSRLQFAVRGPVSNILSIYVERQSYRKGETAKIAAGLNIFMENSRAVYAEASMADLNRSYSCGPTARTALTNTGSATFSIPITNACDGFVLSVKLLDAKGFVLDEDVLNVDKDRSSRFIGYFNLFLIFASIVILLSAFAHKRHERLQ